MKNKRKLIEKLDALAPAKEEAKEFAHKYINEEPKQMKNENEYTEEYILAQYGEIINSKYRKNTQGQQYKEIEKMVAKHTTKRGMVVYRGICDNVLKEMKENAREMEGVDLYEKSFLQTSMVKGCEAKAKNKLRIYIPKGTQAVYLGNVNNEQHYYEVDIQVGTKLKIIAEDKEYITCRLVKNSKKNRS